MPRKFSSYLIRWWRRGDTERLEVEHIQSGKKRLAASLEDAVAWLDAQEREGKPSGTDTSDQSEGAGGEREQC